VSDDEVGGLEARFPSRDNTVLGYRARRCAEEEGAETLFYL
jgi:hypothetical protein